jgi:hypothetical protein
MRSEAPQHPPGASGAVQRAVVVDDEALAVAKPERCHAAGELGLGRQHVRRRIGRVRHLLDVEEDGAGDMLGLKFGPRIARVAGQEQSGVDHLQVARAELPLQPFGGDERFHNDS